MKRNLKNEISSDEDQVTDDGHVTDDLSDSETPAQKRLRLAKRYIGLNAEEELRKDLLKKEGKFVMSYTNTSDFKVLEYIKTKSTCVGYVLFNNVFYYCDLYGIYSNCDGTQELILKEFGLLTMDISFDGKYLVSFL